jgi:CRP-like cAMP-binding protein
VIRWWPSQFNAIPLLASIRPADRAALEPLCRIRGYEKGDTVFREAEPADRIYFVVEGRVKIVKATGSRDLILEILGAGEPVGAVAAFDYAPGPPDDRTVGARSCKYAGRAMTSAPPHPARYASIARADGCRERSVGLGGRS